MGDERGENETIGVENYTKVSLIPNSRAENRKVKGHNHKCPLTL